MTTNAPESCSSHAATLDLFGPLDSDRYKASMADLVHIMQDRFPILSRQTWIYLNEAASKFPSLSSNKLQMALLNFLNLDEIEGDIEERQASVRELGRLTSLEKFVVCNFAQRVNAEPNSRIPLEDALSSISGRPSSQLFLGQELSQEAEWEFKALTRYNVGRDYLFEVLAIHSTGLTDDGEVNLTVDNDQVNLSGFGGVLTHRSVIGDDTQIAVVNRFNAQIETWFRTFVLENEAA